MSASFVVLTDFSALPNRALSYAARLAEPMHAQLVLLHVRHDGLLAPTGYHHAQQAERQTVHALYELAAGQPVTTEVDISDEFLSDAVKEAVHRHHPLLLVLGRPGSATAPQEIVVSAALDLLRHVPYPLLIVPTVGWQDAPLPTRVLLAVDGEPFRLAPQRHTVRRLLRATQGTLAVVHVTDADHARPDAVELLDNLRQNDLVDELRPDQLHEISRPAVVAGVLGEAERLQAELLVVVARRHCLLGSLFHRSVTAQLIQESPVPLLLLPAED
ncbi:universal stress protein [Hymenobacter sp. DH14]|uniref:Universal stress protein n=1 Tax=Hymenobacter cyanobacteriorum TaxID=2926463 RepID=A0A9X1VG76_9BACT|nr:universal stress protein [Hymenobacter cyanobacteriorum]MCI1188629.1 universal stress protein [Hymenobacter cyanobacteriorum]